jgi:hypothetical protein
MPYRTRLATDQRYDATLPTDFRDLP